MRGSHITLTVAAGISLIASVAFAADTIAQPEITSGQSMQTSSAKSASEVFLESNKAKPGVVTLADGLQYKVIKEGKGPKPQATDTVVVHYVGTLVDGKEFDSSYKRGEPATFPVSAVIAGWTEALQLMNVGSTWELYIPSSLAYGAQGVPPIIGPNETLVFKVELLDIKR